ncbi:MAG: hypothetical protein ACT6RZ_08955 [Methylophilus sp.]|uniref:hypothetical protein n=1 Tax=Methylophilus sp. TaxID=29541 RepID=UPI004035B833
MINTKTCIVEYPIQAISPAVIQLINECSLDFNIGSRNNIPSIIRTFECFLQITDQKLNSSTLRKPKFAKLCIQYVGAMYDPDLFDIKIGRKYDLLIVFIKLIKSLALRLKAFPFPQLKITKNKITDDVFKCINAFKKIKLNEDNLWIWRGWPCENKNQATSWPNLFPLYDRFGKHFTESFYKACKDYMRGRAGTRIPCIRSLINFIASYPEPLKVEDFNCPEFMGAFWRKFLKFYIITEFDDGNGMKISTITARWRHHFKFFVETYLNESEYFSKPWGEFPLPPAKNLIGSNSNVTVNGNGELVKTKLLTDIPLNVSDEEALKLLFKQIQTDVDIATEWATWQVNDVWERYQSSLSISLNGQIITKGNLTGVNNGNRWLTDRANPHHLDNAARTLFERNHLLTPEALLIMPRPLTQTAKSLGMPMTGTFLPHCILLISNHPVITSSFLENLELFDKHGRLTGFVESDGNYKLVGVKKRRGSRLAQQIVILNEITTKVVKQIIELSSHIREYLKQSNDDNWRYLLLTCTQGFTYPTRINKLSSETHCKERRLNNINSLKNTSDLSLNDRKKYIEKFNLSSLRASAAVLIYLKTQCIEDFSIALGHATVKPFLIKRYLPEPILAFFQERWIRIFQTAIIVESLKESELLFEASGFKSIDQLDAFFKEHALKLPPSERGNIDTVNEFKSASNHIYFGVNSIILTLMISLQKAVEQATRSIHAKANYWAELTKYLVSYIELNESHRPDLRNYLDEARRLSNPLIMQELIYD